MKIVGSDSYLLGRSCGRSAIWGPSLSVLQGLIDSELFTEFLEGIVSLELLQFDWCVLIQELIDGKVATADLDVDLASVHSHCDLLRTKLVGSLRLSHEHNLKLRSFRIVVDELSKLLINLVVFDWDVDSDLLLQLDDVVLQSFNLHFGIFQLFEELQRHLLGTVDLLFKQLDVV